MKNRPSPLHAFPLMPVWLVLCAQLAVVFPSAAATQQSVESHENIRTVVAGFVKKQTQDLPGKVDISVKTIDPRITLSACSKLEAFVPNGGKLLGNSTVGVRCAAPHGWSVFVPVQVKVRTTLVIAARPLRSGQVLQAGDLGGQAGELTQPDILTDPAQALGKVINFSIGAGQVLKQNMLREPYAVKQGQTVVLQIVDTGFRINRKGHALNNAAAGQQVRARVDSGRIVSGTVQADGIVAVRP